MNRRLLLVLFLAVGAFAVDPAAGVREAAEGWRQGSIKQDRAALDRFLADDLTYAHSGGLTQTKAEYIAAVTKGPSHYESFGESGTKITVYGNTAVLTGFVDVKAPGREAYRVRTLEVYVQNQGRWQMAAHQSARVSR